MPKTFPIMIEVEEIALGQVLRRLNEMPGIAKLHLDLGHGGGKPAGQIGGAREGAGRKAKGQSAEQQVVALLMSGPKTIDEVSKAIGGKKTRAYGALHQLKKKGIAENGGESGLHKLTAKAMAELKAATGKHPTALPKPPAPDAIPRGPGGRASPGSGSILLRAALDAGPVSPATLRAHLAAKGMSPKSISGVLDRAKRDSLVKKNGSDLYELTAKGMKLPLGNTEGVANG